MQLYHVLHVVEILADVEGCYLLQWNDPLIHEALLEVSQGHPVEC